MSKKIKKRIANKFLLFKFTFFFFFFFFSVVYVKATEDLRNDLIQEEPPKVVFLHKGKVVERALQSNESYEYKIEVFAGQLLDLVVEQKGIDVVVILINEKGNKVKEVDSPNGSNGTEPLYCLIETTGIYKLEIKSFDSNAKPGNYKVLVNDLRIADSNDKEKILAEELSYEAIYLRLQENKESLEQALEKQFKALIVWEKFNDLRKQEKCFGEIALIYLNLNQYENSIKWNEKALQIAKNLKDERQAEFLNEIGLNHYYLANYAKSKGFYEEALTILENSNSSNNELKGTIVGNLGLIYVFSEDLQQSIDLFKQALEIFINTNNTVKQPSVLLSLGSSYQQLGKIDESLIYLNKALSLATQLKNNKIIIEANTTLGKLYANIGDYQESLRFYYTAFILIEEGLGDKLSQGIVLNDIGYCYASLKDPEKSLELYNQALAIFASIGYSVGQFGVYNNLGLLYSSQDKNKDALECFSKALKLKQEEDSDKIKLYINIGTTHLKLKEFNNAYEIYNTALQKSKESGFKAQEIAATYGLAELFFSREEYKKVRAACESNLKLLEKLTDLPIKLKTLFLLAKCDVKEKNYESASKVINEALSLSEVNLKKLQEDDLRVLYLSSIQDLYEFNINLNMEKKRLDPDSDSDVTALKLSEASRARSLLALFKEKKVEKQANNNKLLMAEKNNLQKSINAAYERLAEISGKQGFNSEKIKIKKKLEEIKKRYALLKNEIYKNFPLLSFANEEVNIKEIQKNIIDKNTLVLEYFLGKDKSYLWAITSDYIKVYDIPAAREVEILAAAYIRTIKTFPNHIEEEKEVERQKVEEISKKLSAILLAPVMDELRLHSAKRLIIIPDKILHFVPFAALPELAIVNDDETIVPLIINHEVVYLPSMSLIVTLRKENLENYNQEKKVTVIADPVFEKTDLRVSVQNKRNGDLGQLDKKDNIKVAKLDPVNSKLDIFRDKGDILQRLLGTREEAEKIKEVFKSYDVKVFLNFDSSLSNFLNERLEDYRIIHFATHGIFNNTNPELSGLVFSLIDQNGNEQPGFLTSNQIFSLNLNADLVVLSACETGLGKEVKGEGIVGLSRAFFYAGAKRVITSFWKINDKATTELMIRFYKYLINNKTSCAEALRRAQISMIKSKEWSHPFYWAAFQLQGEWK